MSAVAIPEPGARFFAATDVRFMKAGIGAFLRAEYDLIGKAGLTGWSLQGLGMLRKYLTADKRFRLHVWDSRYRTPDVSMMHTHPWDFESVVVAGGVNNHRYIRSAYGRIPVMEMDIICGEGGGPCPADARQVSLEGLPTESFSEGQTYTQKAEEIHVSFPTDGAVTIIDRRFHEDTETAKVFYEVDGEWVSAEPRPATTLEVMHILSNSISRYF